MFILDKPVKEDGTYTLLDLLTFDDTEEINSSRIEDHISNKQLYSAIQKLTDNQRQILSLAYVSCLNDSEIAEKLNKSQQAVSKSHKRALNKLKRFLEKKS